MIQPGFVLGLLETFLDPPPGPGDPGQIQQRRAPGPVADVVRDLGRITDRTPREQPVPAPGPPAVPIGIRAQSYSRGPCAPAPTDNRRHARAGRSATSSSARASASPVVASRSLTLVASTYPASCSSSHTRRYLTCPYASSAVTHANGTPAPTSPSPAAASSRTRSRPGSPPAGTVPGRRTTARADTAPDRSAHARARRHRPGTCRSDSSRSAPPSRSTAAAPPPTAHPSSETRCRPRSAHHSARRDARSRSHARRRDTVDVPVRPAQEPLHAVRRHLAGLLGQRPAVLPLQPRDQPGHVLPRPGPRL